MGSDGRLVATGSGGSNRIRTAVLQVLVNLLDFRMSVHDAVTSPRIHFEQDTLNVEGGFPERPIRQLVSRFPRSHVWEHRNLFFGGAHTASYDPRGSGFDGIGDVRRSGVCVRV
jgi:gamma-glutamyltranspeptidase/glutathione hydrolase